MKLNEKLTLVISSCEAYSDLWNNHVTLLNENWPDRPIDTFIVTDKEHECIFSDVAIYAAGESLALPQRLRDFASKITSEYILITLDDYYIDRPIETDKIIRAISIMDEYNLDYFRFWPYPHERIRIQGVDKAFWIDLNGTYKVNLYPAIWRTSFFLNTVKDELSPWDYEVTLTKIAKELDAKCAYSKNKEFHIVDVIRKGKLLHPAKRFLDSKGMRLNRDLISRKQEILLTIRYYGREIIPKPILRFIKKLLVKKGYKFYSDGI